ncbi:MAG: metallopeptidase family protein [Candidatus Peribacteraceae bacterium]|nr:metallopeptidase family protein [Candidatus Peribacteraceae bacterium]
MISSVILDSQTYHAIVQDALGALPPRISAELKDVAIVIEDEPPPGRQGILLGLYEGVPLTTWGREYSGKLTDKITLYRASIERVARTEEEIPHLVRETLWHEIAHYFGFDHAAIGQMERRWRNKRVKETKTIE